MGIYGMIAYLVTQRAPELGVRNSVSASRRSRHARGSADRDSWRVGVVYGMKMTPIIIACMLASIVAFGQTRLEFEVASIKPAPDQVPAQVSAGLHIDGAQIRCTYLSGPVGLPNRTRTEVCRRSFQVDARKRKSLARLFAAQCGTTF